MASTILPGARAGRRLLQTLQKSSKQTVRNAATTTQKREGDISDAFASLSGLTFKPLEPRFAELKAQMIAGNEEALYDSWNRLLASLREEIPLIAEKGPKIVPEIDFKDIDSASEEFKAEHRKRGVAVIRNVVPEQEALAMKKELREYLEANPWTKAFPKENPQVSVEILLLGAMWLFKSP